LCVLTGARTHCYTLHILGQTKIETIEKNDLYPRSLLLEPKSRPRVTVSQLAEQIDVVAHDVQCIKLILGEGPTSSVQRASDASSVPFRSASLSAIGPPVAGVTAAAFAAVPPNLATILQQMQSELLRLKTENQDITQRLSLVEQENARLKRIIGDDDAVGTPNELSSSFET
jgi:hypothetical protein